MKGTKMYNSKEGRTARPRVRAIGTLPKHLRIELAKMDKNAVTGLKIASSLMLLNMGINVNARR